MADQVLIVDDDPAICKLLEKVMRSNEMDSQAVGSGEQALRALETRTFDIILLDVNLWDMEGFEVLRRLREGGSRPRSSSSAAATRTTTPSTACPWGADDYVTKPFRPVVLGAKVKALLRRSREFSSAASQQLRCGPFRYDGATMRFFKGEEVLDLSSREGALLLLFLQHPNQVFTKDMLYERVWGTAVAVDDNAIMVYINRLRGKIEPDRQHPVHIRTVRGWATALCPDICPSQHRDYTICGASKPRIFLKRKLEHSGFLSFCAKLQIEKTNRILFASNQIVGYKGIDSHGKESWQ